MRRKQKVGVVGCGARGSCGGYSRSIALLFLAELSPPPPPPPVVKKPSKQSRSKALKEDEVDAAEEALTQGRAPTVHSSSSTPQRPQPSKEPKMHSSTPQHPQPSKEPTVHSSTPQRPQPSRESAISSECTRAARGLCLCLYSPAGGPWGHVVRTVSLLWDRPVHY